MAVTGADSPLMYLVEISEPDRFDAVWWQIGNSGSVAQVAAALTELAARVERDLSGGEERCWIRYAVRRYDGGLLCQYEGSVRVELIPGVMHALACAVALERDPGARPSATGPYPEDGGDAAAPSEGDGSSP
ncbi:hypothetical protein [Nocardia sp. NPDC050710]|uniref:hypothetical protein n=1 Tax=Nocardia sp. NPDC050710 TaxID=3157220 RepID=UPI0033DE5E31